MSETSAAASSSLKGKRKKKIPPNPNPLFTQWLTEWKLEAVERGWKSAHVYAKALKTIKLFPLPLTSGKDCRLLQNFGDKICKMLDEKLEEYKRTQGFSGVDSTDSTDASNKSDSSASARNSKTSKSSRLHNIGGTDASASDTEIRSSPQKKKPRATGSHGREYVPAYRSGPYALVLTLYRYMQDPEFKGYMTKSELSHSAQPLSDKSFIVPEPGSHYTAWSSMGVLIKKCFVSKSSNPARYSLTDEGYLLGKQLHAAETQDGDMNNSHQVSGTIDSSQAHKFLQGSREISEEINLPNFGRLHYNISSDDNDDDGDLGTAITQSLLSYSQERSARSSVPASFPPTSRVGRPYGSSREHLVEVTTTRAGQSSGGCVDLDDSILVVCDEDVAESPVLPARTWARFHSLSPSQSSPPQYTSLARLPRSEPSLQTGPITPISASSVRNSNTNFSQDKEHSPDKLPRFGEKSPYFDEKSPHFDEKSPHFDEKSPHFDEKLPSTCDQDILEISDDDDDNVMSKKDDDINIIVSRKVESVPVTNSCESDSDELPDLDIPLWKRLAQKGHAESGLLKNLATSLAVQSLTSQKVIGETNRENDCPQKHHHRGHFSKLKDKPAISSHPTSKSSAVILLTEPCNTLHNDDISCVSVRSTNSLISINTVAAAPVNVPTKKSAHGLYEETRNVKCMPNMPSCVTTSMTTSLVDCCPSFTFLPGSFDIILCIDNREFYGSKGCSKTLLPDLITCGIACELRLLHVGDLLWIARERGGQHMERKGRELVLPHIIERKRMDDLVSSMTDGRMKEQKFRLKHCGLSEPIILIEEYGSIKNFSISEDRIKQSIVNSQVIDGFKVKRCAGARDAVTYIATMTRFLTRHYCTKTLHAVSLDQLKLLQNQQPLQKQEHYLIPFDVFNEASVKQKNLTVRELFAKQLIQVPGVSADRAKAITSIHPSFSHLLTTYERCADDKDRQKLLSGIKCGKKERNLGNAVSNMLYMLYAQKGSLL